ncbi:MAG TPA: NifB/NifX family molybdenum-iron cluster-binding protein [Eubacteriales bacterium]|nr:NifB/NifX family molybdenum-iron cluster-binding protein [Eubacteriales bacterium]
MKIAFSCTGTDDTARTDPRFGRCEAFAVADTETQKIAYMQNAAQSAAGGAGIAAAQQLIDAGVKGVLTGNLGPNAFRVLSEAGIKAYCIGEMSVPEALAAFMKGGLAPIGEAGNAHAGMRGGPNA